MQTYNLPKDVLAGMGVETDAAMGSIAAAVGEPIVSLFLPAEIEMLLRVHGFEDVDDFGPDEARTTYFPGRDDVRFGGAQRLVTGTITR